MACCCTLCNTHTHILNLVAEIKSYDNAYDFNQPLNCKSHQIIKHESTNIVCCDFFSDERCAVVYGALHPQYVPAEEHASSRGHAYAKQLSRVIDNSSTILFMFCFLQMNDVLLYTAPYTHNTYQLKNMLPLVGMRVRLGADEEDEELRNEFSIISTQRYAAEKVDMLRVKINVRYLCLHFCIVFWLLKYEELTNELINCVDCIVVIVE